MSWEPSLDSHVGAKHLQSAPDACTQTKEFLLAAIVGCSFPLLVGREKTKRNSSQGLCAWSPGLIFIIVSGTPAEDKSSRAVIRSAASLFCRSERNICTCCSGFCQECLSVADTPESPYQGEQFNVQVIWSEMPSPATQADRAVGEIFQFATDRRQDWSTVTDILNTKYTLVQLVIHYGTMPQKESCQLRLTGAGRDWDTCSREKGMSLPLDKAEARSHMQYPVTVWLFVLRIGLGCRSTSGWSGNRRCRYEKTWRGRGFGAWHLPRNMIAPYK